MTAYFLQVLNLEDLGGQRCQHSLNNETFSLSSFVKVMWRLLVLLQANNTVAINTNGFQNISKCPHTNVQCWKKKDMYISDTYYRCHNVCSSYVFWKYYCGLCKWHLCIDSSLNKTFLDKKNIRHTLPLLGV